MYSNSLLGGNCGSKFGETRRIGHPEVVARDEELPCILFLNLQKRHSHSILKGIGNIDQKSLHDQNLYTLTTLWDEENVMRDFCRCRIYDKLAAHLTSSPQDTTAYSGRRRDYLYDSALYARGVTDDVEV